MPVKDERSTNLFDQRAEEHKDYNSVLDAGKSLNAKHSNILHDYFSKKTIQSKINFKKDDVILDYGCGVGRLSKHIHDKVKKVIGVDSSSKMLELARTLNPAPNIVYTNKIEHDSALDIVFSFWVLAHMNNNTIKDVFSKIKLKKDGKVFIFEQTLYNESKTVNNDVYNRRPVKEYADLFNEIGFTNIKTENVLRMPSYSRDLWNKLSPKYRFILPILYKVERKTLNYKPENIEYYTTMMVFERKNGNSEK